MGDNGQQPTDPPAPLERALEAWTADASRPDPARDKAFLARMRRELAAEASRPAPVALQPANTTRWLMALAACLAGAALLAALLLRPEATIGRLEFGTDGAALSAAKGRDVLTTGAEGRAVYTLAGKNRTLFVAEGSVLEAASESQVFLREGVVLVSVVPGSGSFAVETARGTVAVVGTVFMVEVGAEEDLVSVDQGRVEVRNAAGAVVLDPGFRAVLRGQNVEPMREPKTGPVVPTWAWRIVNEAAGLDPSCLDPAAKGKAVAP